AAPQPVATGGGRGGGTGGGVQDPGAGQLLPLAAVAAAPRGRPPQARHHPLLLHRQAAPAGPRRPRRLPPLPHPGQRRPRAAAAAALYASFHLNFSYALPRPLLDRLASAAAAFGSAHRIARLANQYLDFVSFEDNIFSLAHPLLSTKPPNQL
ncbi:unnamed protein product, partial [Urochloa humidicola]